MELPPPPGWEEPPEIIKLPQRGLVGRPPKHKTVRQLVGIPPDVRKWSPEEAMTIRNGLPNKAVWTLDKILSDAGVSPRFKLDASALVLKLEQAALRHGGSTSVIESVREERDLDEEIEEIATELLGAATDSLLDQVIDRLNRMDKDELERVCEHLEVLGVLEPAEPEHREAM